MRYFDFDFDGKLSDDERDEDADGLTNYDEATAACTPGYWAACYTKEKPYPIAYAGTDLVDPDTDGDGVRDGADDQDHDDVPNLMELSRNAACGRARRSIGCDDEGRGRANPTRARARQPVQPLPAVHRYTSRLRTCDRHPVADGAVLPVRHDPLYLVLN